MDTDHPDDVSGEPDSSGDHPPDAARGPHTGIVLEPALPTMVEVVGTGEVVDRPRSVFVVGGVQAPGGAGRDLPKLERPYMSKPVERRAMADAMSVMRSSDAIAALAGANRWMRSIERLNEIIRTHEAALLCATATLTPPAQLFSTIRDCNARIADVLTRGPMVAEVVSTTANMSRAFGLHPRSPSWPQFRNNQFSDLMSSSARLGELVSALNCMPKGFEYLELERILARYMDAYLWPAARQRRDVLDCASVMVRDRVSNSNRRELWISGGPRVDAAIVTPEPRHNSTGTRLGSAGANAGVLEKGICGARISRASIIHDREALLEMLAMVIGCEPRQLMDAIDSVRATGKPGPAVSRRTVWAMSSNAPSPPDEKPELQALQIRNRGGGFTVVYGAQSVDLPKLKGLSILKILIENPDKEYGVVELLALASDAGSGQAAPESQGRLGGHAQDEDLSICAVDGGPMELADEQAFREYKDELRTLQDKMDDAKEFADEDAQQKISEDIARLLKFVPPSLGGEGERTLHSRMEKNARSNTGNLVATALCALKKYSPDAERHIRSHLKMGFRCQFRAPGPK